MRKITSMAALVAVASLFTLGQMACQPAPDTNRSESGAAPNTNSGREVVDTAAIEAELRRIENDWPRVIKEKDVAAVGRVEADDAVFVYPDGSLGNKEQDLRDTGSGALTADAIEIKELTVKVLDSDCALVIVHNALRNAKIKMPDGKTMDITGEYRFIDTFARRNGEWKLVAGAGARIMAPSAAASPAAKASPTASPAMKASPAASPTARTPAASPPVTRATP